MLKTLAYFMKAQRNQRYTEAVSQRCSINKVFLEISQEPQENTCARVSFFNKVASLRFATLLKKRLWHRCFPLNFAKFLRTSFLTEHLRWLLLNIYKNSFEFCVICYMFSDNKLPIHL